MYKKYATFSGANTLEGYSLWGWFKGNWKTLKEIGKVAAPLVLTWLVTHHPVWTAGVTIVGKALLDLLDFYLGESKLK